MLSTNFRLFGRPDRRLHLAYMRFAEEEHAEAALSDTAAYGIRQFVV